MPKTITVTGSANTKTTPDLVIITLEINSKEKEYDAAMELAKKELSALQKSITKVGFEASELKTTNFNVNTFYKDARNKMGEYREVFGGYVVSHHLQLEFDFDTQRLSDTISAISACIAKPKLQVIFSVKDPEAVKEKALSEATENARRKAECLTKAAGVKLGSLLSIDYSFQEGQLKSKTVYDTVGVPMMLMEKRGMDFVPEDIKINDNVTLVWEMIG